MKASSPPARIAGASRGKRHLAERRQRPGAEVVRRLLERLPHPHEARAHDERNHGRVEDDVRDQDRLEAEHRAEPTFPACDEEDQRRDPEHDLRRDERHVTSASIGTRTHGRIRGSASASSVPSTQATRAFPTAITREFRSGSVIDGSAQRLAEPARREALPAERLASAVEGIQRRRSRSARRGRRRRAQRAAAEERAYPRTAACLSRRAARRRAARSSSPRSRPSRSPSRTASRAPRELLRDQLARVERLVAAEDRGDQVLARQRDEDEQRAGDDPGQRERQRDAPEGAQRRSPRSWAASTSDQSIRSSAAYSGSTISGR